METSLSDVSRRVLGNFEAYDRFLNRLGCAEPAVYNALFSVRAVYCFYTENARAKEGRRFGILDWISCCLRAMVKLSLAPFIVYRAGFPGAACIVGNTKEDEVTARLTGIRHVTLTRRRGLTSLAAVGRIWSVFVRAGRKLLHGGLKIGFCLYCLPELANYAQAYETLSLGKVLVLVTENDIDPVFVALVTKAREAGVKTVKIEHYFIDAVNHNNVLCEYYFYPNLYCYGIRRQSVLNSRLKYVQGGYIPWDVLKEYTYEPQAAPRLVCYISQHSLQNLDERYVAEILSVLPSDCILCIKPHPRDRPGKYDYLSGAGTVMIAPESEDKYHLVSRSTVVLSVMSVLTIEAKHICSRSCFLNYDHSRGQFVLPYEHFSRFINVISNRDQLSSLLRGSLEIVPQSVFLSYFNPAYPESASRFRGFVAGLSGGLT
jgi:hypothetical protein